MVIEVVRNRQSRFLWQIASPVIVAKSDKKIKRPFYDIEIPRKSMVQCVLRKDNMDTKVYDGSTQNSIIFLRGEFLFTTYIISVSKQVPVRNTQQLHDDKRIHIREPTHSAWVGFLIILK